MTTLIAPCGLDCAKCDAYLVTQADDMAGKEALALKWQVEYKVPNVTIVDVTCDGCLASSGRLCVHCAVCEIRKCAGEYNVTTCAECESYACEKLEGFFQMVPIARENLDAIR